MDTNEGDLSDALSENEYEEANLQLLREGDDNDTEEHHDDHQDDEEHDYHNMDKRPEPKTIKTESSVNGTVIEPKKKYDPKDPLRPRRKKARRACYACQRAHLTCGMYTPALSAR